MARVDQPFMREPNRIDYLVSEMNDLYRSFHLHLKYISQYTAYDVNQIIRIKSQLQWLNLKYQALIRQELGLSQLIKMKLVGTAEYPFDISIFPDKLKTVFLETSAEIMKRNDSNTS